MWDVKGEYERLCEWNSNKDKYSLGLIGKFFSSNDIVVATFWTRIYLILNDVVDAWCCFWNFIFFPSNVNVQHVLAKIGCVYFVKYNNL